MPAMRSWPGGGRTVLTDIAANQRLTIAQE
jgi:hypothetical protein